MKNEIVTYFESQPISWKTTINTICFDIVECKCKCHYGKNIIHFSECCYSLGKSAPYNGIYSNKPTGTRIKRDRI